MKHETIISSTRCKLSGALACVQRPGQKPEASPSFAPNHGCAASSSPKTSSASMAHGLLRKRARYRVWNDSRAFFSCFPALMRLDVRAVCPPPGRRTAVPRSSRESPCRAPSDTDAGSDLRPTAMAKQGKGTQNKGGGKNVTNKVRAAADSFTLDEITVWQHLIGHSRQSYRPLSWYAEAAQSSRCSPHASDDQEDEAAACGGGRGWRYYHSTAICGPDGRRRRRGGR